MMIAMIIIGSDRSSYSDDGLLLAPTGALVVAPLPRFHVIADKLGT